MKRYKETLLKKKNERDTRHEDMIKENEILVHLYTTEKERERERIRGKTNYEILAARMKFENFNSISSF